MKKLLITIIGIFSAINIAFGGGIVTNTNQSTSWTRMLVRDASTSIDAVYYNPAGLTKLSDGLHISISNQSIFQNRTISNSLFPGREWEGKVNVPFYPNLYIAYKTGKFAFSFGFTPIGGGGSANYSGGVPMIELPLLQLHELPSVTGHSVNASFEGSSIYYGFQGGISYAITDWISLYAGARYVLAKNKYVGSVADISVITAGGTVRADTYMNSLAGLASAGATQLHGYADGCGSFASVFGGTTTFDNAITAATGNQPVIDQLTGLRNGLGSLGVPNPGSVTLAVGEATYDTYGNGYTAQANQLTAGATLMGDQDADVVQNGTGITPIVGLNLSLLDDKLNIGLKYEFQTNIDVTNETPQGKGFVVGMTNAGVPIEMFPDGAKTNADIPAMLSVGVNYKFSDKFSAQVGYHTYFDKGAGWSVIEDSNPEISKIDKNYWELGTGLEYAINDKILVSCGFLTAMTGANAYYHSDLGYSINSNTVGLGGAYKINDMISLELGGFKTWYKSETILNPAEPDYTQTYGKSNLGISIGLNFNFGGE